VLCINPEDVEIQTKSVYFVRTINQVALEKDGPSALNLTSENFDTDVAYGEISHHIADSLKNLMHHCYFPFLKGMDVQKWGLCEENQKEDYLNQFKRFNNEFMESIKNSEDEILLEISPEECLIAIQSDPFLQKLKNNDKPSELINSKENKDALTKLINDKNKDKDSIFIKHLYNSINKWLETLRNVITDKQTPNEEAKEGCGLRNEMD
jgi:hypothetical protein